MTAPFLFGIDGRLWFVFLAKTENDDQRSQYLLRGRAFLFADSKKWKKEVRTALEPHWQRLRSYDHLEHGPLSEYAESSHQNAIDFCSKTCSFFVDVSVRRSGTTDISFPSAGDLPADAPLMPGDPIKKGHILQVIASQLFFFIKDLGHRHQHHHPATDQLVLLHELQAGDDYSWRDGTLYSMYRKIIEIKRHPHISTFSDSLGILAYADAFAEISKEELKEQGIKHKLPTYYAKHMADSIKATQARVERQFTTMQRASDALRTTIIAVASVIFSFIGVLKLTTYEVKLAPHWIIVGLLEFIVSDPLAALVTIGLLVWVVLMVGAIRRGEIPPVVIAAMRLLQWMPRLLTIGVLVAIGAFCALLFVRFIELPVQDFWPFFDAPDSSPPNQRNPTPPG